MFLQRGYRPYLVMDLCQNWSEIQCADLQLDLAGIRLAYVEQVFNEIHLGLRIPVDHFQRTDASVSPARSQDEGRRNDSRQWRPQFVDGHRDQLVFPPLCFARGFSLVDALNGEAGLRGNQVQQCNFVLRKRTRLLELKDNFSHKLPARLDWNDEIVNPASPSDMGIRYQVLGFGKGDECAIGPEDLLNFIERDAIDALDTFRV